jgi:hypothetical protein
VHLKWWSICLVNARTRVQIPVLNKRPKPYFGVKGNSLTSSAGRTEYPHIKDRNLILTFHPVQKSTQNESKT